MAGGKGMMSGTGWHTEVYYQYNRNKKTSDVCRYLYDDFTCQNSKSYHFLSKCRDRRICPFREPGEYFKTVT